MILHILEFIRHYILTLSALGRFAVTLVMLAAVPRLCRRAHVPEVVGLLLGGVIVGPYVLGLFTTDRPVADFIGELGKLLLMFFAGLEIDLELFRRTRTRSIGFGLTTTAIPLLLGTGVGFAFG
jgi:Kef-type K+ transport system membrane component KefB